jgi:dihydrofolate reductase
MRKLILSMHITVDGFVAGQNGELNWPITDQDVELAILDLLNTADTILLGRIAYKLLSDFWPTASTQVSVITDKMNTLPKVVFSRTLENVSWGKWNNASLIKENIKEEIIKMKQQPGKNMVLFGGARIAQILINMGLVDEYHLWVQPVSLGHGKPIFKDKIKLNLLSTRAFNSGCVLHCYQPEKAITN